MATTCFAMWLLQSDVEGTNRLIMIFIGIIAVAIAGVAIVLMIAGFKALKTIKELGVAAQEFKGKILPLIDEATHVSKISRQLIEDAGPKVKTITENLARTSATLVDVSHTAKSAVQKIEMTVDDANQRAQRQVARVDGMVSSALTTTSEIVDSINHGIRVPAQKIAAAATQAKYFAEGLMAKIKTMAANSPFGGHENHHDPYQP